MTEERLFGRLMNGDGELIAEGPCWVDEPAAQATLEPTRTPGMIQKERGDLTLELESGRTLRVSDKAMVLRLWPPAGQSDASGSAEAHGKRSFYRLRVLDSTHETTRDAQDAAAAGAVGKGVPTSPQASPRLDGETPAAR